MEAQRTRAVTEEPGRTVTDEIVSLEPIEGGDDLTVRCTKCFENLDRCIKATEIAGEVNYLFSRTILAPIRNIMHERRLRLSIWMSDCGVHGGDLTKLDSGDESDLLLIKSLKSTFARIDDSTRSLFNAVQSTKSLAEQAYESTDDRPFLDPISKQEKLLENGCDSLNTCLYDLAKLQDSLQLALGVRGLGPEAALYKNIKSVQASFPPDDKTTSTTGNRTSKRTSQEKCDSCGLLFPAYTLASHRDSCLGPNLKSSTEAVAAMSGSRLQRESSNAGERTAGTLSPGPRITILEPSSEANKWRLRQSNFSLDSVSSLHERPEDTASYMLRTKLSDFQLDALPRQCYVFLHVVDYPPADGRRERLLAYFGVPNFVANRTCFELNGYIGAKPSYDDREPTKQITSYTTWFRCLVKMVRKVDDDAHDDGPEYATDKKDYSLFKTSVFTRWERPNTSQILCVDAPPDLPAELRKQLEKQSSPLKLHDPFAMHVSLLDQLIIYYDISVWRLRDPVRQLEKTRMRTGAIFGPIHEMSRHAIHTSEILEASIDTFRELHHCRTAVHERLGNELGDTYKAQASAYARSQLSLLKSLKLRSESNQERLKNEINLAFNNLARQDNSVMKSIALLTMIFFPATFFSTLFSTTFFNFGDNGSWQVSGRLWIYWAITIPTIIVVILCCYWPANNDAILRFMQSWLTWLKGPRVSFSRPTRGEKV